MADSKSRQDGNPPARQLAKFAPSKFCGWGALFGAGGAQDAGKVLNSPSNQADLLLVEAKGKPFLLKNKILKSPCGYQSESEKPHQRISNVDRKVFAIPESFCNMFIRG